MPNPFTLITTSPSLGSGLGMSVYTRLSSPPNPFKTIARMVSPPGCSRTTAGAVGSVLVGLLSMASSFQISGPYFIGYAKSRDAQLNGPIEPIIMGQASPKMSRA